MKESKLWELQKKNLNLDFLTRVENKVSVGMPDVFYMHDSYCGWIENKAELKMPKKIKFQPSQPIWLKDYWNKGGTCHICLYVVEENNIYLWEGYKVDKLRDGFDPRSFKPCLKFRAVQKGWEEFYNYLTGR